MMGTPPEKPKRGEPCNGCGFCCAIELCQVAEMAGLTETPCKFMMFLDGRFWCGLVVAEEIAGMKPLIAEALGIDKGCLA